MAGEKNVKYGHATNQTQQFVKQMVEQTEKLKEGIKFSASTRISGSVDMDEDTKRDLSGSLEIMKALVGEGKFSIGSETMRTLLGQAEFKVEASISNH